MTNWSNHESHVRVSAFKPSGKWSSDYELDMAGFYEEPFIHDAVRKAMYRQGYMIHPGYYYVCLEPHHMNAHPVMIIERGHQS